jgi:hypothetical protein
LVVIFVFVKSWLSCNVGSFMHLQEDGGDEIKEAIVPKEASGWHEHVTGGALPRSTRRTL